MSLSPAERFPVELWPHVFDHLITRDIKNARYACPSLRTQACRALFQTITIGPTIYYLNRLRNIVGQIHDGIELASYVKVVEFNLNPLWRGSWDEDPGREEEEETTGTASDYRADLLTEEPWRHLVHFAVEDFSEAFGRLANVQEVRVLSTSYPPGPDRRGISLRQYDPQAIFFQLLSLCRSLPNRVETFKILSDPKLGISQPPLSLASALQREFDYGMGLFTGIRVLKIHLYDQRFKRYRAGPPLGLFDLRHALVAMAATLREFSLTISTPGEDSWQFTRRSCVSHRGNFGRLSFGDMFAGIAFESLEAVYVRNVEFLPRHVGEFLQRYSSTLQKVHMAQWHCELYLPECSELRLLRDIAGPALNLLTLESCENEHMELCKSQINCDWSKKFYWCLNAVKLGELMLDWGLSHDQMCLAVCHTVKLRFNPYLDLPYAHRIEGVVYQHTQRKLLEQPAYRTAMLNTSAEILAERAVTIEAQVLSYFQATRAGSFVNGQLTRPLWTQYMYLQEDLFVFEVNSTPGLYLYIGKSFFHFDKDVDGELWRKHWKKDPESEFLSTLVADQFKEVERDPDATYHFRRKVPDAPNPWKVPFAIEIPDLDAT